MSLSFDLGKAAALAALHAAAEEAAGAEFMRGVIAAYREIKGGYADRAFIDDIGQASRSADASTARRKAYEAERAYANSFNSNPYANASRNRFYEQQRAHHRAERRARPEPTDKHWTKVLDLPLTANRHQVKAAFRAKAKTSHSDVGGSDELMRELTAARDQALRECLP